ncbi:hypothetical protein ACFRCG_45250 [Embleya sp. NPDC056575]|uniref:hypothetical protein n=1 Tax=unclassified Embleya TaxID=2699296 RepID=UPI0036CCD99A
MGEAGRTGVGLPPPPKARELYQPAPTPATPAATGHRPMVSVRDAGDHIAFDDGTAAA